LDTREKIVDAVPENASSLKLFVGHFDPMHAGHVRRLQELCGRNERLGVIVADPPDPILPTLARAELVAGLDCVAYVIALGHRRIPDVPSLIDEREADTDRARVFAQHVLARHNTK